MSPPPLLQRPGVMYTVAAFRADSDGLALTEGPTVLKESRLCANSGLRGNCFSSGGFFSWEGRGCSLGHFCGTFISLHCNEAVVTGCEPRTVQITAIHFLIFFVNNPKKWLVSFFHRAIFEKNSGPARIDKLYIFL